MPRSKPVAFVAIGLAFTTGCLTEGYTWTPPVDVSGIDASLRDFDALPGQASGALEGIVEFETGGGGTPPIYAIRVWLYSVDRFTRVRSHWDDAWDGHHRVDWFDASGAGDDDSVDAFDATCPTEFTWLPDYRVDIEPAPNPATYRIEAVPPGRYCLVVVRDDVPYFAPGEEPACGDRRTVPPIRVEIIEGMTAAPPVRLTWPRDCR